MAHSDGGARPALDPVCGMTVDPDAARRNGLEVEHGGRRYQFCGRGCMLDFREDPQTYLAPGYLPHM